MGVGGIARIRYARSGRSLELRFEKAVQSGERLYADLDKITQVLAWKMEQTSVSRPPKRTY